MVRCGSGCGDLRRVVDEAELHIGEQLTDQVDDGFLVVKDGLREYLFCKSRRLSIVIGEGFKAHGGG